MEADALRLVVQHKTIDSVLKRGEDLDKLVEKSGSLSQQSKMFCKSSSPEVVDRRDIDR